MKGRNRTKEIHIKKIKDLEKENKELNSHIKSLEGTIQRLEEELRVKDEALSEIKEDFENIKSCCAKSIKTANEYKDKYHRAYLDTITIRKQYSKEIKDILKKANKEIK